MKLFTLQFQQATIGNLLQSAKYNHVEHPQTYEPASKVDDFDTSLRNIRVEVNGTSAVIDLIPSAILDQPANTTAPDLPTELKKILADTRPIVEAKHFMRLHFGSIRALVIQEEFIDLRESSFLP